jgi:hypothetical protein
MQAAVDYGTSVYNSTQSMPGDYTKAIMRLQKAIQEVVITGYNTGIYQSSSSLVSAIPRLQAQARSRRFPRNTSLSVTRFPVITDIRSICHIPEGLYIPICCTRIGNLSALRQ